MSVAGDRFHSVRTLTLIVLLGAPSWSAWAHGGEELLLLPFWAQWNWDPIVLTSLVAFSILYARGLACLWGRAGAGRGITGRQASAYAGGMVVLFIALVSPVDPISDQLAAMHMIQHMLLMVIAAPLFMLSAPARVSLWAAPRTCRKSVGRAIMGGPVRFLSRLSWNPVAIWSLHAVALWAWHLPVLYDAALRIRWVHDAQHLSFFVAACLFWRLLLDPHRRLRVGRGVGVLVLFTTSLHASALGAFMALSPRPWYLGYEPTTLRWNLTPLEDQQLAGLIMWMPGCAVYAIAAAILFALWLNEERGGAAPSVRKTLDYDAAGVRPRTVPIVETGDCS